jgi:hypothetical protein
VGCHLFSFTVIFCSQIVYLGIKEREEILGINSHVPKLVERKYTKLVGKVCKYIQ